MKQKTIRIKEGEEKIVPFIWINGKEDEVLLVSELKNENTSVHVVGLFLGTDDHAITFNTSVTHIAKNTKSRTTIRGVFLDRAAFRNDGLVKINNGAKNSDGYFSSKILLFDNAKGRSVPSLEIDENELKAGHASTVGRPDAEQLFYMKSRGLSEDEAQKLLIVGFFDPILALLSSEKGKAIRDKIEAILSV